jgi:Zn-dependent M16 (insulinase) family peptidase
MTQGNVQYVAKGYNFARLGYSYKGSMEVMKTIASYDYLWNRVRVQVGAYGAFVRADRAGNFCFVSYRDPNIKNTIDVYEGAGEFFKNFEADQREMTKYIIGTISKLDQRLTPSMKGQTADEYYFRKITFGDLQKERDEVLRTGNEDVRAFAKMLSELMNQKYSCVLGNESKIKENGDMFNKLVRVFE